jgi:S-DNA-T family DNA segregation ATPase FtsK/SpoIIIE
VGAEVVNVVYGPTVMKFEIQPGPGTKVNSISSLENDLKLALASQNIRIEAPIPGKNLVGIEIANKHRLLIGLKEMMSEANKKGLKNKLLFPLGKDVQGNAVFADLQKMPHLLIAGSTGSGKSVMINTLIISLIMRAKPSEVKLLLIDPKKVELGIYKNLPHMLTPVISDMKKANEALRVIITEMDRRYALFADSGARNLESYNKKQVDETKRLPYYVVIIDELADLMMTANRKEVEDSIMRLTQMARAAGIHLVLATQRPSVDVLTGVIKANVPARIAFSVATGTDSRTILDSVGAEKLTGKGDMLYISADATSSVRAQGAYLSDDEIDRIVEFIQDQLKPHYQHEFEAAFEHTERMGSAHHEDMHLYEEVKSWVIANRKVSTNLLQRKFSLGYNRAANLMDQLEAEGIIGPQQGSKPRTVLV